ncbi:uncharacterized protein FIBRA_04854 [Fibroporia radiculosa]|uniref:Uncharacterized protein n=1 Tax=Fibroporia radiculosa TaxID=599839 RepID=J4IAE0_9APHY|nr:uncharacterized protein FIBRA_04854 [Fibroporia radiculosa]CCM02746.1 predicted protein [Fibroporia radiculosa]
MIYGASLAPHFTAGPLLQIVKPPSCLRDVEACLSWRSYADRDNERVGQRENAGHSTLVVVLVFTQVCTPSTTFVPSWGSWIKRDEFPLTVASPYAMAGGCTAWIDVMLTVSVFWMRLIVLVDAGNPIPLSAIRSVPAWATCPRPLQVVVHLCCAEVAHARNRAIVMSAERSAACTL